MAGRSNVLYLNDYAGNTQTPAEVRQLLASNDTTRTKPLSTMHSTPSWTATTRPK